MVTCTSHQASHLSGAIYFMPTPKLPWKILAKITRRKGKKLESILKSGL
jgi:hypothetical protein